MLDIMKNFHKKFMFDMKEYMQYLQALSAKKEGMKTPEKYNNEQEALKK